MPAPLGGGETDVALPAAGLPLPRLLSLAERVMHRTASWRARVAAGRLRPGIHDASGGGAQQEQNEEEDDDPPPGLLDDDVEPPPTMWHLGAATRGRMRHALRRLPRAAPAYGPPGGGHVGALMSPEYLARYGDRPDNPILLDGDSSEEEEEEDGAAAHREFDMDGMLRQFGEEYGEEDEDGALMDEAEDEGVLDSDDEDEEEEEEEEEEEDEEEEGQEMEEIPGLDSLSPGQAERMRNFGALIGRLQARLVAARAAEAAAHRAAAGRLQAQLLHDQPGQLEEYEEGQEEEEEEEGEEEEDEAGQIGGADDEREHAEPAERRLHLGNHPRIMPHAWRRVRVADDADARRASWAEARGGEAAAGSSEAVVAGGLTEEAPAATREAVAGTSALPAPPSLSAATALMLTALDARSRIRQRGDEAASSGDGEDGVMPDEPWKRQRGL